MLKETENKSYEFTFVAEPEFLHITARGVRTREAVVALAWEIVDMSVQHQKNRILIDVRELSGRLSVFDSFMIVANEFPRLREKGSLKKAVIVDKQSNSYRFRFFETIARNRGFVFSREQLLEKVWGYDYAGNTRTVDVHIRWLRKKIETDPKNPEHILTVRGTGYKLEG